MMRISQCLFFGCRRSKGPGVLELISDQGGIELWHGMIAPA